MISVKRMEQYIVMDENDVGFSEERFTILEDRMGYLIKDTTKEERRQIVEESLGNISASCDGCSAGIVEMYQPYIDGLKELRDINMEFRAGYVSGLEVPGEKGCL